LVLPCLMLNLALTFIISGQLSPKPATSCVRILLDKRSHTGQPHVMLIRALNVAHVHRVAKLLEENFPALKGRVGVIHSEHDSYDLAGRPSSILSRFYSGEYWALVHCGLVGVGFDHKWVSVSCNLGILKSMSPAEQEWGRALRKVPGPPPSQFPELNHPNWGVVVTHSALGLRELFEKFQTGVISDFVKDATTTERVRPLLLVEYSAGETVLKLSDTKTVKPGDVLELRVPVAMSQESVSPSFSLIEELRRTGSLSQDADDEASVSLNAGALDTSDSTLKPSLRRVEDSGQLTLLPWQQEVDAIGERLTQIKSVRSYQVQVEAILDSQQVQITPAWYDFPKGVEVSKSRIPVAERNANFLKHVGLDWQVLVDGELISYQTYQRRVVLQKHGMSLDSDGEIVVGGVRLKDTMPQVAYDLFLKGLEAELATAEVEVPHSDAIARPDKVKMEMQERYGAQVRSLINDLFKPRHLITDGISGRSLVERPVALLSSAIARVQEKGHEPDFANNSALIHAAVFGFVKERTGRRWSEHNSEAQYLEAVALARQFLFRLREQLQWRPWR